MQTSCHFASVRRVGAALLLAAGCAGSSLAAEEAAAASPWRASLSAGLLDFEGDEPVKDAPLYVLRLGRAFDAHWSVEGAFALVPTLDESFRVDWRDGARISRLEEAAGTGIHDTQSARVTLEVLHHLAPQARLSPFLAAGGGFAWYADGFEDDVEPLVQGGGGVLMHLNDSWALRADGRVILAGMDSEFNGSYTLGLQWSPGDKPVRHPLAADVPVDAARAPIATTPVVTVPPATPETPATPVAPVAPVPAAAVEDDNLMVYVLRLGFDPGDWKIKSEYYSEIGVIAKALQDHPGSTAHIEGHVDTYTVEGNSARERLSRKRAEAVRDALVADWGVGKRRLSTDGFGDSRPKGPSEPPKGNAENERIEVLIKRAAK